MFQPREEVDSSLFPIYKQPITLPPLRSLATLAALTSLHYVHANRLRSFRCSLTLTEHCGESLKREAAGNKMPALL
jgi:hypothetical protein